MIWWWIAAMVVAMVVAVKLAPKPQSQPPAGLGDVQVPTAEEGREIPVLFGTRFLTGPNVTWYGDFLAKAVKKKGGKK
jgi:hypothetical protein